MQNSGYDRENSTPYDHPCMVVPGYSRSLGQRTFIGHAVARSFRALVSAANVVNTYTTHCRTY